MATHERDPVTGTDTTGHEWDGIRELNNPLPKWWVYVFYVTIVWSVGYWVVYPSWPTLDGYLKGVGGYSSRGEVAGEMAAAAAARKDKVDALRSTPLATLAANPELFEFARRGGEVAFKENCAACHQTGGAGTTGYPALVDDEWLWGGSLDEIGTTITHGIRWPGNADTRVSEMPRFGTDGILDPTQIGQVADYVVALAGNDPAKASGPGEAIYAEQCLVCHGPEAVGTGAPRLDNAVWLYGGSREAVVAQITAPRHGVMPAWGGRLDEATLKALTVYVHSLGGGR